MKNSVFFATKTLNICGFRCPESIVKIQNTMRVLSNGDILYVISDDPSTIKDIPRFCQFMDHVILKRKTKNSPYHYLLHKGLIFNK